MFWIALQPSSEDGYTPWAWHALQFTPRVARLEEVLLLEVGASERLFGGRDRLLRLVSMPKGLPGRIHIASAATSLIATALLRMNREGRQPPARVPHDLPLQLLSAAQEHVPTLERIGCTTWGGLRSLPRAGIARRFGAALLEALDRAFGDRPERYPWLTAPEVFDLNLELPQLATAAPELMDAAQHLLTHLQLWLGARNRGVLGLELEWALDLRRLNGVHLPSHERLQVRTAEPTQDMLHLRRLVSEHLGRASLAAPANHLRIRTLETVPWGGVAASLLPEDNVKGERLHQLVERLSVRLGEHNVVVPRPLADHRPERMQAWVPARAPAPTAPAQRAEEALYPPWLLPRPQRLEVRNDQPLYLGEPVRMLSLRHRVETGWWEDEGPVVRDYCIARSESAGLLWIYCEHAMREDTEGFAFRDRRWYLQGMYA